MKLLLSGAALDLCGTLVVVMAILGSGRYLPLGIALIVAGSVLIVAGALSRRKRST